MNDALWTKVDRFLCGLLVPSDPALDAALEASEAAGMPAIAVAPNQGKLLQVLARAIGARKILEIGTLGGYSTMWLARALGDGGTLVTLEINAGHAAVARVNLERAGLSDSVEVRVGPALESLAQLAAERRGPFDLIFIDADKPSNTEYFAWALKLARIGTVIIVDNVVRSGAVADPASSDANVLGTRRFLEVLAAEPRVNATAVQTVGSKGHDGFAIAVVIAEA